MFGKEVANLKYLKKLGAFLKENAEAKNLGKWGGETSIILKYSQTCIWQTLLGLNKLAIIDRWLSYQGSEMGAIMAEPNYMWRYLP